jgi:hypothetical protein
MILAMLGVICSLTATPATAASSFPAVTDGNAYGALVTLKSGSSTKVISGPIAPANLDCNTVSNTNSNTVGNIGLGNSVTSGTVDDTVTSMHSREHASIQSVSVVQGVSVLGGAITAQTIHAVATSAANESGASSNADGSSFAGLVVLGVPINVTPGPNTSILLPGIGSVTLNEEFSTTSDPSITSITVNMIHVFVTMQNSLGLRVGTEIIVGHAKSSLELLVAPATVQANSYGLLAKGFAGHLNAESGPFAPAAIGCGPGSATDQILGVSSPVGTTGTVTDKAMGNVSKTGSMAGAESDIASVSVLNALISADSIDAIANVQLSSSGGQRSGSLTFVNAKIAGMSIAANPAANTRIDIANLGYAIVNEQIGHANRSSASETVNGIHLFVTMANSFNLPIGATITIAHVHAATDGF